MWDKKYVLVRTYSSGVFVGDFISKKDDSIILENARRLWFWSGAASVSELAERGSSKPNECKFPCEVRKIELFNVIEIIEVSDVARQAIKNVPIWSQ